MGYSSISVEGNSAGTNHRLLNYFQRVACSFYIFIPTKAGMGLDLWQNTNKGEQVSCQSL